eukprot:1151976-Pelagomonas_calceolata.AAC.5
MAITSTLSSLRCWTEHIGGKQNGGASNFASMQTKVKTTDTHTPHHHHCPTCLHYVAISTTTGAASLRLKASDRNNSPPKTHSATSQDMALSRQ